MEKLADNGIIQEATEAVTKGYPCAFYVPQLLEVIKNKEAEIFNLNKEISALKLKNDEFLKSNEKAQAEIEKKQSAYELCKQEYDSMFNANRNLLAENERLKDHVVDLNKKVKHEAYREFVCRIKAHAYYIDFPKEHRVIDEDDIDNTLKELTDQTATNHSVSLIDGHIEE